MQFITEKMFVNLCGYKTGARKFASSLELLKNESTSTVHRFKNCAMLFYVKQQNEERVKNVWKLLLTDFF